MTTAQALPQMTRKSAYEEWENKQGVPIVGGFYIADINDVEVKPWGYMGADGAIVDLEGCGGTNSGYVVEIAPGKSAAQVKHMFEALFYVTKGRGATTVWISDTEKHSFEWQAGAVFSVPLNSRYQHFNGSGSEPARLFAVTTAPTVMNLFHNED